MSPWLTQTSKLMNKGRRPSEVEKTRIPKTIWNISWGKQLPSEAAAPTNRRTSTPAGDWEKAPRELRGLRIKKFRILRKKGLLKIWRANFSNISKTWIMYWESQSRYLRSGCPPHPWTSEPGPEHYKIRAFRPRLPTTKADGARVQMPPR